MNVKLLNPHVLSYIGDSYYEHQIRMYLITLGITKSNDLHKMAVKFTSGKSQALIIRHFLISDLLTQEELSVYKKGRNISGSGKRNLRLTEVHDATGFEALIGYLALKDYKRGNHIIDLAIKHIEENNGKRKS